MKNNLKNNFEQQEKLYINMINEKLLNYIKLKDSRYDVVKDAMIYSLFAGGKRVRPILTLEFCRICGGDIETALPFACAVEMIHCYSLIHDDLPCMDDDDMRRGQPSCHMKFGEANALLAGDALLTLAFEAISTAYSEENVDAKACIKAVETLSRYAGVDGMVGGQVMDLADEGEKIDSETLYQTHKLKTAALICAACELGVLAANGGRKDLNNAKGYGYELGIAFQIVDDILDVVGDERLLGKPIGSDLSNEKTTFVTLYSLDKARELADRHTENALDFLNQISGSEYLSSFTDLLLKRVH